MEKLVKQIPSIVTKNALTKPGIKDFLLKGISLFLGLLLWYFVVGEDQVDINVQVPLEVVNLPADLVISNEYKKDINVSVRGARSLIQELRDRHITRPVDLSRAKPGTFVVKNDSESIPFPRGITVLRVQPTNIVLLLDKLIQKRFSIDAITDGVPLKGYEVKSLVLEPDSLVIAGPKTVLNSELALKTFPINLDGLNKSTMRQIHLNLQPDFIDLIGETVVTAQITIGEKLVTKTVLKIPVNIHKADRPVTIKPNSISVTANIPENLLRETPKLPILFRAAIVVEESSAKQMVPVTVQGINVPGHDPIEILKITPEKIEVTPLPAEEKNQTENRPQETGSTITTKPLQMADTVPATEKTSKAVTESTSAQPDDSSTKNSQDQPSAAK